MEGRYCRDCVYHRCSAFFLPCSECFREDDKPNFIKRSDRIRFRIEDVGCVDEEEILIRNPEIEDHLL